MVNAYRQLMYLDGACLLYVCCSECVGVCGKVCCVAAVDKDFGLFDPWSVEVCCMFV